MTGATDLGLGSFLMTGFKRHEDWQQYVGKIYLKGQKGSERGISRANLESSKLDLKGDGVAAGLVQLKQLSVMKSTSVMRKG